MSASRRERRKAHAYKAQRVHTHERASTRRPGTYVYTLCTRPECRKPKGEVR